MNALTPTIWRCSQCGVGCEFRGWGVLDDEKRNEF